METKQLGRVSALCTYPIKSTYALHTNQVECTEIGFYLPEVKLYDRQYVIRMQNGNAASLREYSRLTLIKVRICNGRIHLDAPDLPSVLVPTEDELEGKRLDVNLIDQSIQGVDCGEEIGEWLSKHLGKPGVKLLYFSEKCSKRTLKDGQTILRYFDMPAPPENPQLSFPDFAPYAMLSEESVADLNGRLEDPVSYLNFRPNIVIHGCKAYAEDAVTRVRIGSAEFNIFALDPRCTLINVNPETGARHPKTEPYKTLKTYRPVKEIEGVRWPHMGVYMTLVKPGCIAVGDDVHQILESSNQQQ